MKFSYSNSYTPPAPVLEIRLGYPGERLSIGPLAAIIDTGADGTLIPLALVDKLGAPFVDDIRIRSHWEEWRNVQLFTVDVGIGDIRLPAIEVVGDPAGIEIVLGRNLLNRMAMILDGPENLVELLSG